MRTAPTANYAAASGLQCFQLVEISFLFHQLVVAADFDNLTVPHRNDPVRIADRGKSVCYQEGRAVFHHVAGRFLNFFLGGRIQRARGFIEYDDLRLTNQCPGDGNSLTLTAGKLIPVFSQLRIDAIRKLFDHILQSDILYDLHHFLFRHTFQTVSDIVQNRSGKQHIFL